MCSSDLSRLIGDQEIIQISRGTNSSSGSGHSSSGSSVTRSTAIRRAVLPAELMNIPGANRHRGITGYFLLREGGLSQVTMPGAEVFGEWLEPPNPEVPDFVPRDASQQYLQSWTEQRAAMFELELHPKAVPGADTVKPEAEPPKKPARRRAAKSQDHQRAENEPFEDLFQ